jgi:putative ABC transport system ATP-binding protein
MAERVVEIQDASKNALKGVSINFDRGDFMAVLAPSGSGKTTLLKLIAGMEVPASGRITVDGIDVGTIGDLDTWRASTIGYIYEENNLIPTLTVSENVELQLSAAGVSGAGKRERIKRALAAVGLEAKAGVRAGKLNMEEEQLAALARALAAEPSVILADEPGGRLNPEETGRLIGVMAGLNRNAGYTFIVATHDPGVKLAATDILELNT